MHFSDETEQQKCMIEFNNTELEGKMIKCRSARQQQRYQSYGQNYAPVSTLMFILGQIRSNFYAPFDLYMCTEVVCFQTGYYRYRSENVLINLVVYS